MLHMDGPNASNYLGLDNSDTAFYLGDSFTINFNRTVHAVGLYLIAGRDAQAGDMQLSVPAGSVSNSATADTLVSGGQAFYLGLVESAVGPGFTSATVSGVFTPSAFLAITADDITSAVSAVPAPAHWSLMLIGLGALSALARRRRRHHFRTTHTWEKTMPHFLSRCGCAAAAALALIGLHGTASAQATEPFLGQIMCAGFTFAPKGWAELNGQVLSIAQNTALFSLLGTTYGGNGQTTFALPDMRGRVLMHAGQGPGLTQRDQGASAGSEQVSLNNAQLPAHNHTVTPQGSSSDATLMSPANGVPATKSRTTLYAPGPGVVAMSPVVTSLTGGNAPVSLMQPFLAVKCFIAMQGVYPAQN